VCAHVLQALALLDQHGGEEVSKAVDRHVAEARRRQGWVPDPLAELVRITRPPVQVTGDHGRRLDRSSLGLPRPNAPQDVQELIADVDRASAGLRLRDVDGALGQGSPSVEPSSPRPPV
jgi:hypothetical protein